MEKVDSKLSKTQPQLKFADAYKKKACTYYSNKIEIDSLWFILLIASANIGAIVNIFTLLVSRFGIVSVIT